MKKKTIAILGSTGSIGKSSLEIIKNSSEFKVKLLLANKNYFKILEQIKQFKPSIVIISNICIPSGTEKISVNLSAPMCISNFPNNCK